MLPIDLNKSERIKFTLKYLADKLGQDSFKIKDHWDADLIAVGIVDKEEKYLVYFSAYEDNDFYVSLENLVSVGDLPHQSAGEFSSIDLDGLVKIVIEHLKIK